MHFQKKRPGIFLKIHRECEDCKRTFRTEFGLKIHHSKSGCGREQPKEKRRKVLQKVLFQPHPPGQPYSIPEKQLVLNCFISEKNENPGWKHKDLCLKVHQRLGVGKRTVYKVSSEAMKQDTLTETRNPNRGHSTIFDNMDKESRGKLRKLVHQLIQDLPQDETADQKYVTIKKIHESAKSIPEIPDMSERTLYSCMKRLGFR